MYRLLWQITAPGIDHLLGQVTSITIKVLDYIFCRETFWDTPHFDEASNSPCSAFLLEECNF
jgi:hypothetical protein